MDNYKEKYNQALRKALDLYNQGLINPPLEHIFPELQEDNDDRIRKSIMNLVKKSIEQGAYALQKREADDMLAWLEKQGNKSVNIDIEPIISSYKQRLKSQGGIENTPLFDMCLTAFRHGVENVLEELNLKTLDPDKVIEWLRQNNCTACWDDPNEAISQYIERFKKDFGL